ncbi:hypothetical protein CCUS01_00672 [Colletotrichum cuscutae]|uniref:Uncharacterized protein n=1 Tax=Colletotrichum cuscutae TaxID=1209917 RepID=A0AAI9VD52_9PEZI|nr:hypothetical protein CCUS01_00672 [Colletotrichum cuscutae]
MVAKESAGSTSTWRAAALSWRLPQICIDLNPASRETAKLEDGYHSGTWMEGYANGAGRRSRSVHTKGVSQKLPLVGGLFRGSMAVLHLTATLESGGLDPFTLPIDQATIVHAGRQLGMGWGWPGCWDGRAAYRSLKTADEPQAWIETPRDEHRVRFTVHGSRFTSSAEILGQGCLMIGSPQEKSFRAETDTVPASGDPVDRSIGTGLEVCTLLRICKIRRPAKTRSFYQFPTGKNKEEPWRRSTRAVGWGKESRPSPNSAGSRGDEALKQAGQGDAPVLTGRCHGPISRPPTRDGSEGTHWRTGREPKSGAPGMENLLQRALTRVGWWYDVTLSIIGGDFVRTAREAPKAPAESDEQARDLAEATYGVAWRPRYLQAERKRDRRRLKELGQTGHHDEVSTIVVSASSTTEHFGWEWGEMGWIEWDAAASKATVVVASNNRLSEFDCSQEQALSERQPLGLQRSESIPTCSYSERTGLHVPIPSRTNDLADPDDPSNDDRKKSHTGASDRNAARIASCRKASPLPKVDSRLRERINAPTHWQFLTKTFFLLGRMTGQQGPGGSGEEPVAHQTKTQKEGPEKGGGGANERHKKVAGEDTSVLCRYVLRRLLNKDWTCPQDGAERLLPASSALLWRFPQVPMPKVSSLLLHGAPLPTASYSHGIGSLTRMKIIGSHLLIQEVIKLHIQSNTHTKTMSNGKERRGHVIPGPRPPGAWPETGAFHQVCRCLLPRSLGLLHAWPMFVVAAFLPFRCRVDDILGLERETRLARHVLTWRTAGPLPRRSKVRGCGRFHIELLSSGSLWGFQRIVFGVQRVRLQLKIDAPSRDLESFAAAYQKDHPFVWSVCLISSRQILYPTQISRAPPNIGKIVSVKYLNRQNKQQSRERSRGSAPQNATRRRDNGEIHFPSFCFLPLGLLSAWGILEGLGAWERTPVTRGSPGGQTAEDWIIVPHLPWGREFFPNVLVLVSICPPRYEAVFSPDPPGTDDLMVLWMMLLLEFQFFSYLTFAFFLLGRESLVPSRPSSISHCHSSAAGLFNHGVLVSPNTTN